MTESLPIVAEARKDIAACLRLTKDADQRKALVVLHLVAGRQVDTVAEVAARVGEEPEAVSAWLDRYRSDGITAFASPDTREALEAAATRGVERSEADAPAIAADRMPTRRVSTALARSNGIGVDLASAGVEVMLGEADDLVARIIEAKLEREGISVRRSRDGAELVSVLEESSPNLVLADVRLAGLDGFQVARWIREHDRLGATPVILLGWPGKETDVVDAFDAGADDFVLKPFSPIDLFARVRRLVERHGAPPVAVDA